MTPKAQADEIDTVSEALELELGTFLLLRGFVADDETSDECELATEIRALMRAAKAEGLREGRDIAHAIATKYARGREARDGAIEVAEAIERRADAEGASK